MAAQRNCLVSNKSYRIGLAGIVLGIVCLATLYLIGVYGPGSYSSSSSGSISADGTILNMTVTRSSELPRVALTAFYLLFASLLAGIVSGLRKERPIATWGALAFGLTPVLLMTVGVILTTWVYFGILLPAVAVMLLRRASK
jgi:hypothetical protein